MGGWVGQAAPKPVLGPPLKRCEMRVVVSKDIKLPSVVSCLRIVMTAGVDEGGGLAKLKYGSVVRSPRYIAAYAICDCM